MMKVCSGCKELKDESEYSKNKNFKDNLQYECKACMKGRIDRILDNDPDYFKRASKKYADRIRSEKGVISKRIPFPKDSEEYKNEAIKRRRESENKYRRSVKGRQARRSVESKERMRNYAAKKYTELKADPVKYEDHREYRKKKLRDWFEKNKDYAKLKWHERRARIKGNGGSHTSNDIQEILESQKHKCVACGVSIKSKRHIDHIIPLSKGGTNDKTNIQLLCPSCNIAKKDKHPIDFMQSKGFLL